MKGTIIALMGVGGATLAYALYAKSQTAAKKTAVGKGTLDNNYVSSAKVFAADQATNQYGRGPHGIVETSTYVAPTTLTPPSGAQTGSIGTPSGTTVPNDGWINDKCVDVALCNEGPPQAPDISPTFWAADKVPTNPALQTPYQGLDANPTLGDELGTYLLSDNTAIITPVNQV